MLNSDRIHRNGTFSVMWIFAFPEVGNAPRTPELVPFTAVMHSQDFQTLDLS
jgi:hypothetical protein